MRRRKRQVQGDPLDQPDVIDIVSTNAAAGQIRLTLVATNTWDSGGKATLKLQAKLKNYVAYAADGQLLREYPEVAGLQRFPVLHL